MYVPPYILVHYPHRDILLTPFPRLYFSKPWRLFGNPVCRYSFYCLPIWQNNYPVRHPYNSNPPRHFPSTALFYRPPWETSLFRRRPQSIATDAWNPLLHGQTLPSHPWPVPAFPASPTYFPAVPAYPPAVPAYPLAVPAYPAFRKPLLPYP